MAFVEGILHEFLEKPKDMKPPIRDISGQYTVKLESQMGNFEMKLIIEQDENQLEGKLISEMMVLEGTTSFQSLLGENYTRLDIVITFLALLELVKQYRVEVSQETLFSEICIEASDGWENGEEIDIEFAE